MFMMKLFRFFKGTFHELTNFGIFTIRNKLPIAAIPATIIFITSGAMPSISATSGARTVTSRADILLNPNIDAVYRAGVNCTLAMKLLLNAAAMPNFAIDMKTGLKV